MFCNSCGASQKNANQSNCSFCGALYDNTTHKIEQSIQKLNEHGNKFKLAEVAYEGENYDEALNYYNSCLEIDTDFFEAWYKKGLCLVKTSTVGNLKSNASLPCFKQAINNSPNTESFKKRFLIDIVPILNSFYTARFNHFINYIKVENAGKEFAFEITKANDVVNYIISEIGIQIGEVKSLYTSISKITTSLSGQLLLNLTNKTGEQITHAMASLEDIEKRLKELWCKLEPNTAPKKKGCFIATATLGSYDDPIVKDLRIFRDTWLMQRRWGVNFTNWYYKNGPIVANIIEKNVVLKKISLFYFINPLHTITLLIIKIK